MIIEDITELQSKSWDVVVIGTGMGGATAGFALARSGKRVLFLEQGLSPQSETSLRGKEAETFFVGKGLDRKTVLARAGRMSEIIEDHSEGKRSRFTPFVGVGCGGSSAIYGAVFDRFRPSDFDSRPWFTEVHDSSLVPWPITYTDLEPFYSEAESLYEVHGERDPLFPETCSPLPRHESVRSSANQKLFDFFTTQGVHPYALPRAIRKHPECSQGYLDAKGIKVDSATACLMPAIEQYRADLVTGLKVVRLGADHTRITEIECVWNNTPITLKAPTTVILACGALQTPALLLKSRSTLWPNGLANRSGMVGKNLMRHFVDLYGFRQPHAFKDPNHSFKEFGFNDWYTDSGLKLGTVQAFGSMLELPVICGEFIEMLRENHMPRIAKLITYLSHYGAKLFLFPQKNVHLYATILEDLPYQRNTVSVVDDRIVIQYTLGTHEHMRVAHIRKKAKAFFASYRHNLYSQTENNRRLAHVSGTCRFGDNPQTSVLDRFNRAHDIENMYVVDSSFFPTSGGTNPSLTIAANALRVAKHINEL